MSKEKKGSSGKGATSAPYNFVPLAEWIFTPEWGSQASQDRPFRDGVSGTLAYTLVAESPLLVGGLQKPASVDPLGEVYPFRMGENGAYAIPGSSLKGMLRAVVEVAAFARMRMVDDQRLSVRDLTAGARAFYGDRMTERRHDGGYRPKPQAGWLRIDPKSGGAWITPCQFARVEHDDLAAYSGDDWWKAVPREPNAKAKYKQWHDQGQNLTIHFTSGKEEVHQHSQVKLAYRRARKLGRGDTEGTLVFTGQPAKRDRNKNGRKHMEFIFFGCDANNEEQIREPVWRDFLHNHGESEDWKYWRKKEKIPVFYLTDKSGGIHSIGLALMYRLAYEHSIHQAIRHTNPEHLEKPGKNHRYDLADLLFGAVGQELDHTLRARVACEYATAEGCPELMAPKTTILNAPKPTYYPNYIVQPYGAEGGLKADGYATFMDSDVMIRGFKRYPARPLDKVDVQPVAGDQKDNKKIQVKLHPLREGARFRGRIRFHNLRPTELGALIWAMSWGGNPKLRHGLGMGKPFGYGQVRLEIDPSASEFLPNDPQLSEPAVGDATIDEYRRAFTELMEAEHRRRGGPWAESPQIVNLLAMADPANAPKFEVSTGSRLHHPTLDKQNNEFQAAKKETRVLPDYALALGIPTGTPARGDGNAGGNRGYGHPWLDEAIPRLMEANKAKNADEVIRGRALAKEWSALEGDERGAVKEAIRALWETRGLMDDPPKAQRKLMRDYYGFLD